MTTAKPWYKKAWKALRKRWVQVCVTLVAGLLVAGVAARVLGPARRATSDKTGYKYLHCNECKLEMSYNPELDGRRCPKCKPPKSGYFIPTQESIKTGYGDSDPWKWVYIACGLDAVGTLGVIVYLLYLPVPDPTSVYYLCNCPHCGQRTRFRQVALGGIGQCPRCKRPFRFPDEDDAVREADFLREQEAQALYEYQDADADDE